MFGSSVAEACQTRLVNIDPWPRIIEASVGRFIQKHDGQPAHQSTVDKAREALHRYRVEFK